MLRRNSRQTWLSALAPLVLFGGVLACYWPALRGGLVWDDAAHVTRPELRTWQGLGRIWTDVHATQQYYPVLHTAFWLEHRIWGDATLGYHLANVVWHSLACCLLAWVVMRLGGGGRLSSSFEGNAPHPLQEHLFWRYTAWLAATLFAVHPVCVESVAWISEQKNTLSLVFYLVAALLYLDFHDTRGARSYVLATIAFVLALGTKSVTATLPAALCVALWWKRGSLQARRDVLPLLPWFACAAAAGLCTAWIEHSVIGAKGAEFELSLLQRLLLAGRVIWFYLGKLVWPQDLIFIYPHWEIAISSAVNWACLAGAVAVTGTLWLLRKKNRGPLAAWLFFVGSLFPALGFINVYPFRFSYVADHFQYLPATGIITLAAAILARVGLHVPRWIGLAVCSALVVTLTVASRQQSAMYRDSKSLYEATLRGNPECWMAHNNLAAELSALGRVAEAVQHYEAALKVKPDNAEAENNLGNALALLSGREAEAIGHFEKALSLQPEFPEARLNFANTLARYPEKTAAALVQYKEALRLAPLNPEVHFAYANLLVRLRDRADDAEAEYRTALQLRPGYTEAHVNYGSFLVLVLGKRDEGLAQFEEALRFDPTRAKTHYNYALALAMLPERQADAIAHYRDAIRLEPGYAEAHNNLGILYAQRGELNLAREEWEAAVRINPEYADPARNLRRLQQMKQSGR